MNYEHLTDDELIVAVAEAKGWKIESTAPFLWHIYNPSGELKWSGFEDEIRESINLFPDYRQPAEYMALMGEIWKTKPGSILAINGVAWNLRDGNYCEGVFGDYPRWRAICIAWLIICGGKDE